MPVVAGDFLEARPSPMLRVRIDPSGATTYPSFSSWLIRWAIGIALCVDRGRSSC